MVDKKILVPFNFTTTEEKTLAFVIDTFGQSADVDITLFHVYPRMPVIDLSVNPEMLKIQDAVDHVANQIEERKADLDAARQHLLENGFKDNQIKCMIRERQKPVSDEIIKSAMRGHYDMLILSRRPGKMTSLFTRSVHTKILSALKNVVVCVVT